MIPDLRDARTLYYLLHWATHEPWWAEPATAQTTLGELGARWIVAGEIRCELPDNHVGPHLSLSKA